MDIIINGLNVYPDAAGWGLLGHNSYGIMGNKKCPVWGLPDVSGSIAPDQEF